MDPLTKQTLLSFGTTVGTMLLGYAIYKWQTRTQTKAAADNAEIQTKAAADQAPINVLTAAVAAANAELAKTREAHETMMRDTVIDLKQSFKELSLSLASIQAACAGHCKADQDLAAALQKHAEDSTRGRGTIHNRFNNLQYQLATGKVLPPQEPTP